MPICGCANWLHWSDCKILQLATKSCYSAGFNEGNITLGIVDSCNYDYACYKVAAQSGEEINTINASCNSDFACAYAASFNVGGIPSGINGCCNTGNATSASEGICYFANETTLFVQDPACIAPVSVSATADSGGSDSINDDSVPLALGDFLTDLAHELYKLVKELAKNKKE